MYLGGEPFFTITINYKQMQAGKGYHTYNPFAFRFVTILYLGLICPYIPVELFVCAHIKTQRSNQHMYFFLDFFAKQNIFKSKIFKKSKSNYIDS